MVSACNFYSGVVKDKTMTKEPSYFFLYNEWIKMVQRNNHEVIRGIVGCVCFICKKWSNFYAIAQIKVMTKTRNKLFE